MWIHPRYVEDAEFHKECDDKKLFWSACSIERGASQSLSQTKRRPRIRRTPKYDKSVADDIETRNDAKCKRCVDERFKVPQTMSYYRPGSVELLQKPLRVASMTDKKEWSFWCPDEKKESVSRVYTTAANTNSNSHLRAHIDIIRLTAI